LISSITFRKTLKYQISYKSFHWAPSYFIRTSGQANATKQTIAFRSSAKTLKNSYTFYIIDGIEKDNETFTYGWFRAQIECKPLNI